MVSRRRAVSTAPPADPNAECLAFAEAVQAENARLRAVIKAISKAPRLALALSVLAPVQSINAWAEAAYAAMDARSCASPAAASSAEIGRGDDLQEFANLLDEVHVMCLRIPALQMHTAATARLVELACRAHAIARTAVRCEDQQPAGAGVLVLTRLAADELQVDDGWTALKAFLCAVRHREALVEQFLFELWMEGSENQEMVRTVKKHWIPRCIPVIADLLPESVALE